MDQSKFCYPRTRAEPFLLWICRGEGTGRCTAQPSASLQRDHSEQKIPACSLCWSMGRKLGQTFRSHHRPEESNCPPRPQCQRAAKLSGQPTL